MRFRTVLATTTALTIAFVACQPAMATQTGSSDQTTASASAKPQNAKAERREAKRKARADRALARERARERARAERRNGGRTQITGATGVPGGGEDDIIVTGIRGSVESARNKKRNAKQIVDSVVAEDAGKLPDNNVPEALARVTGVGIDRVHGEGTNITIRGLSDIQTTINGNEVSGTAVGGTGVESGISPNRAVNLSDIPAELLKAVDVYKTRTADQVEGGIAGTVNVELRRPIELKKGLTLAGSIRGVYSDIGNTKSPYGSILAGYHFDTGIGEMGFLVNAAYERNNYQEDYIFSESPQVVPAGGPAYASLTPAQQANLYIPYRVTYGLDQGVTKRPSINASFQWKPTDNLDFVLEGSWLSADEIAQSNTLRLITNDYGSTYSNIVVAPNGAVQSLTQSNAAGLPGGPESFYSKRHSNNYTTNFEAHWHGGIAEIKASVQYNWDRSSFYEINQVLRFVGATTANVDFDSNQVPGGGPFISFPRIDYSNPASYNLNAIHDQYGGSKNDLLAGQIDLTLHTSDTSFFRSLQFGARATNRTTNFSTGYRDVTFASQSVDPLISSISGVSLATTTPTIPGVTSPTWYHLNGAELYQNFAAVRSYIAGLNPVYLDGGDYSTALPSADNGSEFGTREHTWAAYGQFNYGFKAFFPIDGVIGARVTNTWGSSSGTQLSLRLIPPALTDCCVLTSQTSGAKANYLDFLPNANALVHFTPKLQLRLAYTWNVQRPDFQALSAFVFYDGTQINNPNSYVYSGNPDLRPVKEKSYDASLEYYFGKAGQLTVGAFLKNQTGFIYYTAQLESVPELNNTIHYVGKPRNAGPGKIQGFEFSAQSFFDFLPGFAKNFGATVNLTYIPTATLQLGDYLANGIDVSTIPGAEYAPYTSKYTYNLTAYYDTPRLGVRVAYNHRSEYKNDINTFSPLFQTYTRATSRLDAAINYTPVKFLTFTLDGSNLLRSYAQQYYGAVAALPVGVRVEARTVQAGMRFRF